MKQLCCPHCGDPMRPFTLPENGGWDCDFHFACFNDDCSYFVRGWKRMEERYGVRSSYRYRIDPTTGKASPLAVWSSTAIKDRIMDAEVVVDDRVSPASEGCARPESSSP